MDADRPDETPMDQLRTVRDVMRLLNCSRNTVTRMTATGRLRPMKLGRAVRFHPEDVRRMIEEMRR